MFEFSRSPANCVGFRSLMAKRLSRLFEAKSTEPAVPELLRSELRFQLRPVGVRRVSVEDNSPANGLFASSDLPRSFASRKGGSKAVLGSMASKFKRAASAKVFQRIAERLARIQPAYVSRVSRPEFCSEFRSVVASGPVGVSRVHQVTVVSRRH